MLLNISKFRTTFITIIANANTQFNYVNIIPILQISRLNGRTNKRADRRTDTLTYITIYIICYYSCIVHRRNTYILLFTASTLALKVCEVLATDPTLHCSQACAMVPIPEAHFKCPAACYL